ncbi:hypothetical protein DFA_03698 [Cavenderia fasciculata]|uniref:Uncharacterized protein n=1 Tax=Cavenderia fasciculata TaxID=261658 RepID=F4Q1R1_CACFS|nr:uncharacterized protein DFA_03698 [Cavenderia fasciculata]EGG18211.1 hypothetical protein DFA_03698 [Cavenderia fasciculata]|eukprot:XP_004357034.1 hypothetical protein DFA_03698 [Cavenderia fasciculata]
MLKDLALDKDDYDYGNVIDVQVDIDKEWTEEILGQYLKDAGFVRGSDNTPSNKARLTPVCVVFANRVFLQVASFQNKDEALQVQRSGNGLEDYNKAFKAIGSPILKLLYPFLPPSIIWLATLLVVGAYITGLPGYGRGTLPNTVKRCLVAMNREIPRNHSNLMDKIMYVWNRFHCLPDYQRLVEWNQAKLTQYLKNNTLRQYSTTRYPSTQDNWDRIVILCKLMTTLIVVPNNPQHYSPEFALNFLLEGESAQSAMIRMGRMALPHWDQQDKWVGNSIASLQETVTYLVNLVNQQIEANYGLSTQSHCHTMSVNFINSTFGMFY